MAQKFIKIFDDTVLKQTILQGIEDERTNPNLGKFSMGELAFTRDTGRVFVGNYSSSSETQNSDPVLGGILVGNKYLGHVETKREETNQSDITSPLYYVEKTYSNEGNTTTGDIPQWIAEPVLTNTKSKSTSYNKDYEAYNGDYVIDPYASSIIFFDNTIKEDEIDKNASEDKNAPFNPFMKHPLQGRGYFIFRNIEPDNDTLCYDVKNSYHNIIKLNKVPLNLLSNSFDETYFKKPDSGTNNTISLHPDAIRNIFETTESSDGENGQNTSKKLVYSYSNGSTNLFNQNTNLSNNAFLYLIDSGDNKEIKTLDNLSIKLNLNGNLKFKTSDGYTRSETKPITPSNPLIDFSEIVIHSQSENKSTSTQTLISDPFDFQKDIDNSYAISGTNVFDNGMLISTDNIPNNFKEIIDFDTYASCTECYSHDENSLSSLNYFKKPSLLCQNDGNNGKLQKIVNYDISDFLNDSGDLTTSVSSATHYKNGKNTETITEVNKLSVTKINDTFITDDETYKFYVLDDQNNNKIFYSIKNLYDIIYNNDFSPLKKIKIGDKTHNIVNVTQTDEETTIKIDNTDEPFNYHTLIITYENNETSETIQSNDYVFKNDVPSDVWEKLSDNDYVKIQDSINGSDLITGAVLGTSLTETFDPFFAEYYYHLETSNDTNTPTFYEVITIDTIEGEPRIVEYYDGGNLKKANVNQITFCDEEGNTTFKTPDDISVEITSNDNKKYTIKTNATHFRFKESDDGTDYKIETGALNVDENGKLESVTYEDKGEEKKAKVEEITLLQELTITHEQATHFYFTTDTYKRLYEIDDYYGFFVSNTTRHFFDETIQVTTSDGTINIIDIINNLCNQTIFNFTNDNYIPRHAQSVILGIHCNEAIKVFTNNTIEAADELPSDFTATYNYESDSIINNDYKLIYQRSDAGYGTIELPMYKDKNGGKIASFYPLTTKNTENTDGTTTTTVGKFKIYILGYRA